MDITEIRSYLFMLKDDKNADFQRRLTPTADPGSFLGVRIPQLRVFAKEICRTGGHEAFLSALPHSWFDENILHGCILSELRDYDACISETDRFLPYVDNWSVCDTIIPKIFGKNKERLINDIRRWIASGSVYTVRFGIKMLMSFYLDGDFVPEYPELVCGIRSDEYYINMMSAWYFATALAKQWNAVIPYFENRLLDGTVYEMAVRKACESFRISDEQKNYLKSLKERPLGYLENK